MRRLHPNAPTALTAGTPTATTVPLSWTASSTGGATYAIYQDGVQVGTSAGTAYTATGLVASTAYTFTVRAVLNAVESVDSNSVIATTSA